MLLKVSCTSALDRDTMIFFAPMLLGISNYIFLRKSIALFIPVPTQGFLGNVICLRGITHVRNCCASVFSWHSSEDLFIDHVCIGLLWLGAFRCSCFDSRENSFYSFLPSCIQLEFMIFFLENHLFLCSWSVDFASLCLTSLSIIFPTMASLHLHFHSQAAPPWFHVMTYCNPREISISDPRISLKEIHFPLICLRIILNLLRNQSN